MEVERGTMLHALSYSREFGNTRITYTIDSHENITATLYDTAGKFPHKLGAIQMKYIDWCHLGMAVHDMHATLKQEFGENE